MYTVNEVAEIFKVSGHTVRRWIRDRSIDSVKVFGVVRIPPAEVEQLKTIGRTVAADSNFSPSTKKTPRNRKSKKGFRPWEE